MAVEVFEMLYNFGVHYPFYDGVYKCNQPAFATAFN